MVTFDTWIVTDSEDGIPNSESETALGQNDEDGGTGGQKRAGTPEGSQTQPSGEGGISRREALSVLGFLSAGVGASILIYDSIDDSGEGEGRGGCLSAISDGLLVPAGPGVRFQPIDPRTSDTPVQDALDTVAQKGGGVVFLPPTTITEAQTIQMHDRTALYGFWGQSEIRFGPRTDGLLFDSDTSSYSGDGGYIVYAQVDGVTLTGPGFDEPQSGIGIRDRGTWLSRFGRVELREWNGAAWLVEEGAGTFDNTFEYVFITECDAGDSDGLVEWNSYGATNRFGYLSVFPTMEYSGERSVLLSGRGIAANIESINGGNASGPVFEGYYNQLRIGTVHWEPTNQAAPAPYIFDLEGPWPFSLDTLTLNSNASAEYAFRVRSGGHSHYPAPYTADRSQLTEGVLSVSNLQNDIVFDGPAADVTIEEPSDNGQCHCIAGFSSLG
jgi:hypothetical protein